MKQYLYYQENDYELYKGKMQEVLSTFEEGSVDSIICDPPYELNFMGKGWDNSGVAFQKETWELCFKVLKEGGYLLAFGGSRTFHRIACAIEDAGFEIRDTIMWLYGSGFPKSMNIANSIEGKLKVGSANKKDYKKLDGIKGKTSLGYIKTNANDGFRPNDYNGQEPIVKVDLTTDLAKQWQGWGTALKPAYEPIIVARKPFKCSLIENIMRNGVGGLNIDECRVGNEIIKSCGGRKNTVSGDERVGKSLGYNAPHEPLNTLHNGRFPANVILTYDETDYEEVCGGFPYTKSTGGSGEKSIQSAIATFQNFSGIRKKQNAGANLGGLGDEGSASRYFYCAKASKKDRDEGLELFEEVNGGSYQFRQDGSLDGQIPTRKNIHPTVKPVELMQYLVRLVTPKNGTILDCFMGSGSTGKAVMFENRERNANYKFIGVEMTEEYLPICQSRIDYAKNKYEYELIKEKQEQQEKGIVDIFDFLESE